MPCSRGNVTRPRHARVVNGCLAAAPAGSANWLKPFCRVFAKIGVTPRATRWRKPSTRTREYDRAWRTKQPPRLRSFPVAPPRMAPLPRALIDCVVPNLPTPSDIACWLDTEYRRTHLAHRPAGAPPARRVRKPHTTTTAGCPSAAAACVCWKSRKHNCARFSGGCWHRLLEFVPPHEAAHGFRQRHSCVTNDRPHVGQAVVMRMDLTDFFGSIGGGKVYNLFVTLGYPAAAARALTCLTTTATPPLAWSAGQLCSIADRPQSDRLANPQASELTPSAAGRANISCACQSLRVQFGRARAGAGRKLRGALHALRR